MTDSKIATICGVFATIETVHLEDGRYERVKILSSFSATTLSPRYLKHMDSVLMGDAILGKNGSSEQPCEQRSVYQW